MSGTQDKLFDMKTWTTVTRSTSEDGAVSYGFWYPGHQSVDRTGDMTTWRPGDSSMPKVKTSELHGPSKIGELSATEIDDMGLKINALFPPKTVEPKNMVTRALRKLFYSRRS